MKTRQEFCDFMDEYISKGPKVNVAKSHTNWIGPPSGLEKSIGRKNLPFTTITDKLPSQYDPVSKRINLSPTQTKQDAKRLDIPVPAETETVVAHELGHSKDPLLNKKTSPGVKLKPSHEKHLNYALELRANREGEKLLAQHNRPPMNKLSKRDAIGLHHLFDLQRERIDQETLPTGKADLEKARTQELSFEKRHKGLTKVF